MSWLVGTIVLNEEDYIIASIRSIYDFAHTIVIVHGADKRFPEANKQGLSIDRTGDLIKEFIVKEDIDKKIIYHEVGFVESKSDLRQVYLDEAQKLVGDIDWIMVLDGDEGYHSWQLNLLNSYIQSNGHLKLIINDQFWFWSPTQVCVKKNLRDEFGIKLGMHPKDIPKVKFYEDHIENVIYEGQTDERIFRNILGLSYKKSHSNVCDKDGEFLYSQGAYRNSRVYIFNDWLNRDHYGYLKSEHDMANKFKYYGIRDDGISPENIDAHVAQQPYFRWLKDGKMSGSIPDTKPGLRITHFTGQHIHSFANLPHVKGT